MRLLEREQMKSLKFFGLGLGIIIIVIVIFLGMKVKVNKKSAYSPLLLAMDWTPNTNHSGIYVALAKGWYKAQGIALKILPYSPAVSSDILVSNGKADVGISATEGVVADAASGNPVVSIGAIIQHNTSSLAALANNGITRPRDFDGKIYGGFGAPYENAVVGEVIKKDGGKGDFKNVTLSIDSLQALESHKVDFVWIFDGWEGIQAKQQGIGLITFPINTNGIADYYTPVFITSPKEIKQNPQLLKKFMKATSQGYMYAIAHPHETADILFHAVPKGTFTNLNFILASQLYLSPRYVDSGRKWGLQDKTTWEKYPQFMLDSQAIVDAKGKPVTKLNFNSLFTNQFLP